MRKILQSFPGRICSVFLITFLTFGAMDCSSDGSSNNNNIPEDFNQLMKELNTQAGNANSAAGNFADSFEGFFGANLNSMTGQQIQAAVQEFLTNGDNFITVAQFYAALADAYVDRLGGSNLQFGKFQSVGGGVDTLASDVGGVIQDTRTGEAKCASDAKLGTDDEDLQLYKECIDQLRSQQLAQAANIGVGGVLGGGAGVFAGLAAGAAGATILVPIAVGTGVGIAAGLIWNWCTSSNNLKFQDFSGQQCVFVGCQDTVKQLPDGRQAIACSVPPGTGTVTIFTENGVPIVTQLTVGPDGVTVTNVCIGNVNTASTSDAQSCIDQSTTTTGADVPGAGCEDILTLNASATPPDPAPGQSVLINYSIFPKVSGCPTSYTVSGTDGYAANGSPATDSNGAASFTIPGGAEGVVDTVGISESTNGNSKSIVYTF